MVFTTNHSTTTIAGVVNAAHFRGDLEPGWKRVRALDAADDCAEDESDLAEVQALSEQFRVDRDLITAEETEQWLEARGLTLDDFGNFFLRHARTSARTVDSEIVDVDYSSASPELRELLRVELLLTGEFDRLATELAWRVAARETGSDACPVADIEAERDRFHQRSHVSDGALDDWLARLGRDREWLDEMLEIEGAFRRQCDELLTPESHRRMLSSLHMQLTRFDLEAIELESREAAREALLCVSTDGMDLAEVAEEGRYPYRRFEILCEDLPEAMQQKLLCASTGEVIEPIERGDEFEVCRLLRKIEPDAGDDETRRRVESRIVEQHFSELATRCVRWIMPMESSA